MAFRANLAFEGENFDVLKCEYSVKRDVDSKGRPSSNLYGAIIKIVVESTSKISLFDKSLPPDARPREKLLARGPAALGDAELLAILLRTGTAGRGVLQMAQEVLSAFGGLHGLLQASGKDVDNNDGVAERVVHPG